MITKTQALTARTLEHVSVKNKDGTPLRVRVTGKCKTWKTKPDDFKLPVKYGLRDSFYIGHFELFDNTTEWNLTA